MPRQRNLWVIDTFNCRRGAEVTHGCRPDLTIARFTATWRRTANFELAQEAPRPERRKRTAWARGHSELLPR